MYNAIEVEDPGFIAETEAMIRNVRALMALDPLDAGQVAHLEWLLDELAERRPSFIDRLHVEAMRAEFDQGLA